MNNRPHRKNFVTQFAGVLVSFILLTLSTILNASESEDSTISYGADYFAEYQVVTLIDMIQLVPGGVGVLNSLNDGQQSRGIGSSGAQILIDGKRMSGKANDMETRLNRIQANQVKRIDLIRGNAEGLDIRSQGVLINVILKSDARDDITYFTELRLTHNTLQNTQPEFLITGSGRLDQLEFDIGLNHDLFPNATDFREQRLDPQRQIEEIRTIRREFLWTANSVTSNLQYTFDDGDVFRINGLYKDVERDEENLEDQFAFTTGNLVAEEQLRVDRDDTTWEIGGDYTTDLGEIGTLKTIFVSNKRSNTDSIIQDEIISGQPSRLFTFAEDSDEIERIIRTNLSTTMFLEQTLEIGAEAAFNELDALQSFDLGPFESSKITEDRYELFVTHSLVLNDSAHVQTSVIREQSTIKQDAIGIQNKRSFDFWKPRVELRYDLDASNQLRFVADRTVSQLNLRNFIATRNTEDDTINFGNPDLEPEKVWQYLIAYERRIAKDTGTLEIELFKDEISDFISDTRNADGSSGRGNIGAASRMGLNVELSSQLPMIGMDNARLTLTYRLRDSEMIDPFLNVPRGINFVPDETMLIDFRHDLTDLGIVYGFEANKRTPRFRQNRTVSELRTNNINVNEMFVEYSFNADIRLRFEIWNPFNDKEQYDRTFYAGDIADGMVDRIEFREREIRPVYMLRVQSIL